MKHANCSSWPANVSLNLGLDLQPMNWNCSFLFLVGSSVFCGRTTDVMKDRLSKTASSQV